MCINPDGEFIAPFDIEVVKILRQGRKSEWSPQQRTISNDGNIYFRGTDLHYPPNTIVDSPGGPGIHCYYAAWALDWQATKAMQHPPERRSTIHAFIPQGTRVLFELGSNASYTVLAADTIVTRS